MPFFICPSLGLPFPLLCANCGHFPFLSRQGHEEHGKTMSYHQCFHLQHPAPLLPLRAQRSKCRENLAPRYCPGVSPGRAAWTCSDCGHRLPWAVLRQERRLAFRGFGHTHAGVNLHRASKKLFLFPWQVLGFLIQALKMLKRGAGRKVLVSTKLRYFLPAPFRQPAESFFEMLP